jgi:periplasmic protein CpxP/Spy
MKMHKLSLIAVLALGSLVAGTLTCPAQSDTAAPGKSERKSGGLHARVDAMAVQLNLTDDQKTKVTALLEQDAKQMRDLRADTTLSKEDRREKVNALRKEHDQKLKAILTPDQWEKWQQHARPGHPAGADNEKKTEPKKAE